MYLDYYKAIQGGINAKSDRDIIEREAKQDLYDELGESIAYEEVYVNHKKQALIITPTKDDYIYDVQALPNEHIEIGDEVIWQGKHFLMVGKYRGTKYQEMGHIEHCNRLVRWQDKDGNIFECWGIVGDEYSRYNRENAIVNVNTDQLTLRFPFCECTKRLYIGKRLALGTCYNKDEQEELLVYTIGSYRTTTYDYDGDKILRLTVDRSPFNPHTDNVEQGICDYIFPTDGIVCSSGGITEIIGKNKYRLSGNPREFLPEFSDKHGSVDSEAVPVWNVEIPDDALPYISYVIGDDNALTLTVLDHEFLIGTVVTITLVDSAGTYPIATKEIEVIE